VLDLSQKEVLERFQLNIQLSHLPGALDWIDRTLRTITSPVFNEFVIRGLYGWETWSPRITDGWEAVDAALSVLAERNPDFKVVYRTVFPGFPHYTQPTYDEVRWFVTSHLPLASSKGLVKLEHVRGVENRCWELRYLDPV